MENEHGFGKLTFALAPLTCNSCKCPCAFKNGHKFVQGCLQHTKTSFEKNCFSAWASTLNMGLINKVDMVCLSPVGYGV